ncbi:MAG: response regulator transcription factor [Chthoniobacterales bacterium]
MHSSAVDSSQNSKGKRRVMVVENHRFFRENLISWIASQEHLECCCVAEDVSEAQRATESCQPDLILLDLTLNGLGGFDFLQWLGPRTAQFPVIVLSQYEEERYAATALEAGARGYVTKAAATEELLPAIAAVLAGDCYISGGRGAFSRQ